MLAKAFLLLAAVDRHHPHGGHRPAEHGKPEQRVLGQEANRHRRQQHQRGRVHVALVIAHHDGAMPGRQPLGAPHLEALEAAALHDRPRPQARNRPPQRGLPVDDRQQRHDGATQNAHHDEDQDGEDGARAMHGERG
jgi:hypothetical protein